MRHGHTKGIALVAASTVFLSLAGLLVRTLEVNDWTIVFWRSATMALFVLAVIAIRSRGRIASVFRRAGRAGIAAGALIGVALVCYIFSITRTTVANTLLIASSAPFFAAIMGRLFLGERVPPRIWVIMLFAFAGIFVMFLDSVGRGQLVGNLFAVGIAVLFAASVVTLRRTEGSDTLPSVFVAGIVSAAIALPFADLTGIPSRDLGVLTFMGVGQLGLGLVLLVMGAKLLPPAETALVALLETVLAPLWVWIAIAERPSNGALAGGLILFGAVLAHSVMALRRRSVPVN